MSVCSCWSFVSDTAKKSIADGIPSRHAEECNPSLRGGSGKRLRIAVGPLVSGWMRQSIHRQSPRATTFTYRFHLVRRRWAGDMATFRRMAAAAGANDPDQRESDECVKNSFFGDALASVRTVFRAPRSSCQRKTGAVQTGISSFGNPESPQGRVRLLEDPGTHGPMSACPGSVGT